MRAKKEEELEEVKRRAAAEAQKARLEQEKMEQEVEKEAGEAKLKDDGQLKKEEEGTKEEVTEEKKDDVKTGGDYYVYIWSIKKAQRNLYPKVEIMVALKHCEVWPEKLFLSDSVPPLYSVLEPGKKDIITMV